MDIGFDFSMKGIALTINSKRLAVGVLALSLLTITAYPSDAQRAPVDSASSVCRRDKAEGLAGKKRISDARARRITGASIVRQIRPGQAVTMDYRQERVTIETDPKSGRIVRAYCG